MKVCFQSRKTLFSVPGGDTIQMLKTAEHLKSLGCQVDISTDLEPDVSNYDLVHLFNLMRPQETYLQAKNAKKYGKNIVLSTIYGSYIEYDKRARGGIPRLLTKLLSRDQIEYLKVVARGIKNLEVNKGTLVMLRSGYENLQRKIVDLTDVFLPNSESEMKRIFSDFPAAKGKSFTVVPNAVDSKLFRRKIDRVPENIAQFRECILCIARIEERKNQLKLVRAISRTPYQLVLVGNPAPNHEGYFRKIVKEAGTKVHFVGYVSHEKLPFYYSVARVHAMPSWMETPGLSSLEAGAVGCNIVVTEKGDTRDYFGNKAFYCEPDSIDSIRDAIKKAWDYEQDGKLREHILKNYTWEKAAQKTMEGYTVALSP